MVVVLAARSSQGGSSFCSDYATLGGITANASLIGADVATVRNLAHRFQKLAGEAPVAARPDLTLLANDMTTLAGTGTPSISDEDAQAAADRVDVIPQDQCDG